MMDDTFSVLGTFREAWKLTRGTKLAVWIPIFFSLLFLYGMFLIIHKIAVPIPFLKPSFLLFTLFWASGVLAGLTKLAIERVRGNPISARMSFRYFSSAMSIIIVIMIIFLPSLLSGIIFLMNLSGVSLYPAISMMSLPLYYGQFFYAFFIFAFLCLAIPLAVDQKISVFSAIVRSVKMTRRHIFKILFLEMMGIVLFSSTSIPWYLSSFMTFYPDFFNALGYVLQYVILFWLVPFQFLMIGVLYCKLMNQH